jgi:hypothetical protein
MFMSELRNEESLVPHREIRAEERPATRLAEEILAVIPEEFLALEADGPEVLRYRVRGSQGSWRIRYIVFGRESLDRLDRDPLRAVKVEYLQRELLRLAPRRRLWGYPRTFSER